MNECHVASSAPTTQGKQVTHTICSRSFLIRYLNKINVHGFIYSSLCQNSTAISSSFQGQRQQLKQVHRGQNHWKQLKKTFEKARIGVGRNVRARNKKNTAQKWTLTNSANITREGRCKKRGRRPTGCSREKSCKDRLEIKSQTKGLKYSLKEDDDTGSRSQTILLDDGSQVNLRGSGTDAQSTSAGNNDESPAVGTPVSQDSGLLRLTLRADSQLVVILGVCRCPDLAISSLLAQALLAPIDRPE
ncbi:hypothetical protein Q5P01_018851 [Channa striata]|uniref:Uncharacterized protein n=1 Tax=Channa striata TaxID=64152 RepID=A0AA88M558_CHASR|nr:hypothetical protein Q5P01_018851 [Channa striata]